MKEPLLSGLCNLPHLRLEALRPGLAAMAGSQPGRRNELQ